MKIRAAEGGFTLIEVLVVAGVTIVITSFLLSNLSTTRADLDHVTSVIVKDIRDVQTRATTAARYQSNLRCGFGLRYSDSTTYRLYTGPVASNTCRTFNRNFDAADVDVSTNKLTERGVEFTSSFSDIFFEPPDPVTFVNNSSTSLSPSQLIVRRIGANCGISTSDCRSICVYTSGRIDTARGTSCP